MGGVASYFRYDHLIYQPPAVVRYHRSDCEVLRTSQDEEICAMCFEPDARADPARRSEPILLFSHGNADDLGTVKDYCQWLANSLRHTVLTYDYPGYGHSHPRPTTEHSMRRAADAVLAYAENPEAGLGARQIVLVGKSLGSVATLYLAARHRASVVGTVLVSPLASGARVFAKPEWFSRSVMERLDTVFGNNIKEIRNVDHKVFIMHGKRDLVVPFRNSEELMCALRASCYYPPLWLDAGHNDIESIFGDIFVSCVHTYCEVVTSRDDNFDSYDI